MPTQKPSPIVNGDTLTYDWLSLNTGPVMNRQRIDSQMLGAREHALFVRPIESFAQLWPWVFDKAKRRKVHVAVVRPGATGLELVGVAAHPLRGRECVVGSRVIWLPMVNHRAPPSRLRRSATLPVYWRASRSK